LADSSWPGKLMPGKAINLLDEAASMIRIRRAVRLPADLREYDEKIAQVRREKESAIDSQDFDKAAALRDTEKQLLAKKAKREKEWKTDDMENINKVSEEVIAEAHAIMSGISPTSPSAGQKTRRNQQFSPATMTDDDREIWAIS